MVELPPQPERLSRDELRRLQDARLRELLAAVVPANPFWTQKFAAAGVDPSSVQSVDDLPRLPFCTKAELAEDHAARPPYGTNLTFPLERYNRLHQTSGTTGRPMRWLDTPDSWDELMRSWAAIFRLVGLRPDDRLMFPFSFGPFIGFWAAFEGACRLGNLCLPGGGISSEARLRMMVDNEATFVCCTPTYALRLIEVAEQIGLDLPSTPLRGLIVAGEPGGAVPATRQRMEEGWGARVFDHWGMTEIGPAAVESVDYTAGQYVLESQVIAEIVEPRTGEAVEPGTLGELVITTLGRVGSPVIRYRTGDLVRQDTSPDPSGRELLRLEGGILGRADEMVTIRGNNVFPSSLEAILREFDQIVEYRITIERRREMQHVKIEIEPAAEVGEERRAALVEQVQQAVKDRLNFQAEVTHVPPETLPRFELKGRRFFRAE